MRIRFLSRVIGALIVLPMLSVSVALGQQAEDPPSRADLLRELRRQRAAVLEPPRRNFWERRFYSLEQGLILNKFKVGISGVKLAIGGFPPGGGASAGVVFEDAAVGSIYPRPDRANQIDLRGRFFYSTLDYREVGGSVGIQNVGGSPITVELLGRHYRYPQEDFYGLGVDSLEENQSNYLLSSREIGGNVWLRVSDFMRVGMGMTSDSPELRDGTDDDLPQVAGVFDPATVPGLLDQPDFRRLDAVLDYDWLDTPGYPREGGRYTFRFSDYADTEGDDFDFRRYEVDIRQYLPFYHHQRVLALRAWMVLSDAAAGASVPFFYLPTLGQNNELRGFREYRFTDRNALLINLEYRWWVWWAMDMAAFVDFGKVAGEASDLFDTDGFKTDYGLGFRIRSEDAFMLRLDVAHSEEGYLLIFKANNVF